VSFTKDQNESLSPFGHLLNHVQMHGQLSKIRSARQRKRYVTLLVYGHHVESIQCVHCLRSLPHRSQTREQTMFLIAPFSQWPDVTKRHLRHYFFLCCDVSAIVRRAYKYRARAWHIYSAAVGQPESTN